MTVILFMWIYDCCLEENQIDVTQYIKSTFPYTELVATSSCLGCGDLAYYFASNFL